MPNEWDKETDVLVTGVADGKIVGPPAWAILMDAVEGLRLKHERLNRELEPFRKKPVSPLADLPPA